MNEERELRAGEHQILEFVSPQMSHFIAFWDQLAEAQCLSDTVMAPW